MDPEILANIQRILGRISHLLPQVGGQLTDEQRSQLGSALGGISSFSQSSSRFKDSGIDSFNTISSESLKPEKEIDLSGFSFTPTNGAGIMGILQGLRKQQMEQAEKYAEEERRMVREREASLEQTMRDISGVHASRAEEEEKAGISKLTTEADDLANQIEQKQLALTREIEEIRKNSRGMLASAVDAEVARVSRERTSELADLAILQNTKNRQLATAISLVDRNIKLRLEPLEQQLQFDKFFLDRADAALSKAEKEEMRTRIAAEESIYSFLEKEMNSIYKVATEAAANGADQFTYQQILQSSSMAEAMQLAGGFIKAEAMGRVPGVTLTPGAEETVAVPYQEWFRPFLQTPEGQQIARQFAGDNIGLARELRRIHQERFGTGAQPIGTLTAANKRDLDLAGISNTSSSVQRFFLGTPSGFRQAWIQQVATGDIDLSGLTVEEMQQIFNEWQRQRSGTSGRTP